jgi:ubiquinol-cytochrome c reductase iron-sulfur subunit
MRRLWRWIVASVLLLFRRRGEHEQKDRDEEQIVPPGESPPGAEITVAVLLFAAALSAAAFSVLYAIDHLPHRTQYLGLALGVSLALIAAALIVTAHKLVASEEIEEDYPQEEHPEEQEKIDQIVRESGSGITRKRLLGTAGVAAGGALGFAVVTPALSLGPFLETSSLHQTPWRRGRRLVDEKGRPWLATDIEEGNFYTAYPEGVDQEKIGSPLVVVRVDPGSLKLPPERAAWAPEGIVAYSKICTHAGCAISLYRTPKFQPVQPKPALVCPCHYSTFDPATGGTVTAGPAGRDLPQLPLEITANTLELRAAGNFSGPVGPSWSHVREAGAT